VQDLFFLKNDVWVPGLECRQNAIVNERQPIMPAERLLGEIEIRSFRVDDVNYGFQGLFLFVVERLVAGYLFKECRRGFLVEAAQLRFFQSILKRKLFQISFM